MRSRSTPRQRGRTGSRLLAGSVATADAAGRLPAAAATVPPEDAPAVLREFARTLAGLKAAADELHQRLEEHYERVEIYDAVPSLGRDWGEAATAAEEAAEQLADAHAAFVETAARTESAVRLPRPR